MFVIKGLDDRSQFDLQRPVWAAQPLSDREIDNSYGINIQFLAWARARMLAADGDQATFWFPDNSQDTAIYQWAMYQLAPARAIERPAGADWAVLYGPAAAAQHLDPEHWRLTSFGPGFAIARALR
jgi:hypothetical protein